MAKERKGYPSDVSDEEWEFCAPYLTLMKADAPQRKHSLRDLFNGLRWFIRAGCPWRMLPNDLPPWQAVQQQTERWLAAQCFERMAEDLRLLLRLGAGRGGSPRQRSSTVARCNRPRRAVRGPVMTGPRSAKAARCMPRWVPWIICWL